MNKDNTNTRNSLVQTVLTQFLCVSIVLFVVLGILLFQQIHAVLYKAFDHELFSQCQALSIFSVIDEEGNFEFEAPVSGTSLFSNQDQSVYFAIVPIAKSKPIVSSDNYDALKASIPDPCNQLNEASNYFWNYAIGDKSIRFCAIRKFVNIERDEEIEDSASRENSQINGADFLFAFGMDLQQIHATLNKILLLISLIFSFGLLLLLLTGWVVIFRGFRPLRVLENEVQTISVENLVPVTIARVKELEGVTKTLNDVIFKLKKAFERERQFTADVAHELRTPISEIRTAAEVALRCNVDQTESKPTHLDDILDAAKRMQILVENLLTLSRNDAGRLNAQFETVNLKPYVLSIWSQFEQNAKRKNIEVNYDIEEGLVLKSDKELMHIILTNLFSNAVEYTLPGGIIRWNIVRGNQHLVFKISNTTSNLMQQDIDHLCERFWRKDLSRTTNNDHHGLGLSLVQSLSKILNFTIHFNLDNENLLEIALESQDKTS